MSFSTLQSTRRAKQPKSFVEVHHADSHTETGLNNGPRKTHAALPLSSEVEQDARVLKIPVGLHTCLPGTLEIRQSSENGRGIYTKEQCSPGSVIMATRPHVSVLSTACLDGYCSYCANAALSAGLKRCARCHTVWYCNATCQNGDWAIHKLECAALQGWASAAPSPDVAIPSDAIRCLGRILWMMQKEGLDSVWTREISMLQSHRTSLPPSAIDSLTHLAHSLVRYLDISNPQELQMFGLSSAGDIVDLISRFTTNAFTLTSPSLSPVGVCLSPSMAFVNHSCEPNAVMVFPRTPGTKPSAEPQMELITIRTIAQNEQLFVSYIDATLPRDTRRASLKDTYNFLCQCTLCRQDRGVDWRTSIWCPKSCGGICLFPTEEDSLTRCNKCNAAVSSTDEVLDTIRIGKEALDKATLLQIKDPAKAKQLATNMIPIMVSAGLTPSSHPLLAMTRLHFEILIASLPAVLTQEALDEVIRIAAKYNAGLSNILTYGHPIRGVSLAELGKLLAVDEPSPQPPPSGLETPGSTTFPPSGPARLKLAHETLVRARDELIIGFGKSNGGGEVGKEVREGIVRFESELSAWTRGIKDVLEDTKAGSSSSKK